MVFLWIAAYGLTYVLSSRLFQFKSPWGVPIAMAAYTGALLLWLFRTGQAHSLGLCSARPVPPVFSFMLLLLPVCNLLTAGGFSIGLPNILLMMSVCAAEEICFRGFLLRHLIRYGVLPAVFISSGAFALFHLVNLLGGSSPAYICMQVLCAFTVGICYSAVAIRSGSLLPGFFAHFLTNITAAPVSAGAVPWLFLCIAVYSGFDFFLCKHIKRLTSGEVDQ